MTTRDDAVRLLEDQHAEVAHLLAALGKTDFTRRGTIGGGDWSAKDLAAHLGSWEEFAIQTLEAVRRGERPAIEDEFAVEGATDRLNEREVERFLDAHADDVMKRFEDLHRGVVEWITSTRDDDWDSTYAFDATERTLGERIGSMLGGNAGLFMHAADHLPDLRAYVDATRR